MRTLGLVLLLAFAAPALAADLDTLRGMLIGVCHGVIEEVTGLPPWQARYLAPALYADCENNPLATIRRLKGGVFVPEIPRPASSPSPR